MENLRNFSLTPIAEILSFLQQSCMYVWCIIRDTMLRAEVEPLEESEGSVNMNDIEKRQRKALEMALKILPGEFELFAVNELSDERLETRRFSLECADCRGQVHVTMRENGDNIWNAAAQIQIKKHLEAIHK